MNVKHDGFIKSRTHRLVLIGVCVLFVLGCRFNPNIQGEGEPFLQGIWVQDTIPHQDNHLTYSLYTFKFTCDSVFIKQDTYSKVKTVVDSCYNNGHWTEYARGVYIVRNDSLLIESVFTHDTWRQKLSGCYRIGEFLPMFKVMNHTKDSLFLQSQYHQVPIHMKKISDITCVPKPI